MIHSRWLIVLVMFSVAVPEIPSAPVDMTYRYSISDTISARFQWAPPARSQHELTGYRIYWAQVKPSAGPSHVGIPTIEREEFTSTLLKKVHTQMLSFPSSCGLSFIVNWLMTLSQLHLIKATSWV